MPVIIPYTFVGGPGRKAKASEVNADFQAIASKFTEQPGGISDLDVYTFADLNANKLSSTAGKRITAAKFEPGAVDSAALKSDPVSPSAGAAVNTSAHIKDGIVLLKKLKYRQVRNAGSSINALAPGISTNMLELFNPTTEILSSVFVDTIADPTWSGGAVLPLRQEYLFACVHIVETSPSSWGVRLLVKNTHPTLTMNFGSYLTGIFTFLQN